LVGKRKTTRSTKQGEAADAAEPAEIISLDDDGTESSGEGEERIRARLIAETMALAAGEGEGEDRTGSTPSNEPLPSGAEAAERGDGGDAEDDDPAPVPFTSASPTRDAASALREMQAQGLIELPGDFVIDLGDAATEDERDRLLAAALAHVEMQEARFRVPSETGRRRRWKGTVTTSLVMLALLFAVAPPAVLVPDPPPGLTESDRTYGTLVALLLQAQQIDAFRIREQRLPDTLGDLDAVLPGIRYVKSSSRLYQLVTYTSDGIAVVYDSAAPAAIFRRIAETWVTTQGAP